MLTKEEIIEGLCERLTRAKERKETAVKQQQHYTQLRFVLVFHNIILVTDCPVGMAQLFTAFCFITKFLVTFFSDTSLLQHSR